MGVSHITHGLGESLGTSSAHSMNLVPTQISYLCDLPTHRENNVHLSLHVAAEMSNI